MRQASAKAQVPASVRPELLKIALRSAAKRGDRHPYDIQAVRVPDNVSFTPPKAPGRERWLYFIAMRAQLNGCPTAEAPPSEAARAAARKCSAVLDVTVLASTLEPLFRSESCDYPDLRAHGIPVHLGVATTPPSHVHGDRSCTAPPAAEEVP